MTDFAKLHADWPWEDAARLRVGLKKRPLPGVPHMTHPKWDAEIFELNGFAGWLAWVDGGKKGARQTWHRRVPTWAWKIWGEYRVAHPKPKPNPQPKPGPERVSKWKNPPWAGIGLQVAWGFESGDWTPQGLADKIAGTKVQWACLEGSPENNEPYMHAFRDAMHGHGRKCGIWERADRQKNFPESYTEHAKRIISTYQPDFYGADIEAFPVDEPSFAVDVAAAFPNLPRIMLVPGEPDASYLKPWFDHDWDMMTQAYAANIGQPPVPGIAGPTDHDTYWRGGQRNFVPAPKGWGSLWWQHGSGPHSVPIIEVWAEGNPSLAAQMESDAVKWFGGNWSIWCAEQLREEDWNVLRA